MANFITIFRIFLGFIALGLLFTDPKNYIIAFVITIFVIWFDGLDGYVARKLKETSKLGAVLDIMSDRVVENIYWVVFCALGWISVIVPVIVLTRGIITDALRSLALAKGYTAFGKTTMMQNKVAKFIVASNFVRFTYAVVKAFAFCLIILGHAPQLPQNYSAIILNTGLICALIAVILCVLRGLPVIFESKRFFKSEN